MFNTTDCPASNSNPDITGVGTRVALYVSITGGLVMTRILLPDEETFRDVTRSAYITSTALCIAGLVSLSNGTGISIVDGLCVTTMTSLVLVYACLSAVYWPEPDRNKARQAMFPTGLSLFVAFLLHSALWTTFGFKLWSDPTSFGGAAIETTAQNNCTTNPDSAAEFWLFGKNVPVTSDGLRAGAMAFFSIGAFLSAAWFVWRVIYFYRFYEDRREYLLGNRRDDEHELAPVGAAANGPAAPADGGAANPPPPPTPEQMRRIIRLTSYSMYSLIALCAGGFIYLILTTEQIITINGQRGNTSQLSFGQILALALLLDQLFQSGTKYKEHLRAGYIRDYANRNAPADQAQI